MDRSIAEFGSWSGLLIRKMNCGIQDRFFLCFKDGAGVVVGRGCCGGSLVRPMCWAIRRSTRCKCLYGVLRTHDALNGVSRNAGLRSRHTETLGMHVHFPGGICVHQFAYEMPVWADQVLSTVDGHETDLAPGGQLGK